MSPVTGLARLEGRILSSVHMGNFSPVTVHMGNFNSVTNQASFIPVTGLEVSYWKIVSPVTDISVAKTEIITMERVVRRDLGSRASPVDWAHTKRSLEVLRLNYYALPSSSQ